MLRETGSKLITASELIHEGKCHLYGYIINSVDTGDFVKIYDGNDPGSAKLLIDTNTRQNLPEVVTLPLPLMIDRGLYVHLDDGIENVTVFYNPIHSDGHIRKQTHHYED